MSDNPWQPIVSYRHSPERRTIVDLWVDGERLANCYWDDPFDEAVDDPEFLGWRQWYAELPGGIGFEISKKPSHWMPLPPAPRDRYPVEQVYDRSGQWKHEENPWNPCYWAVADTIFKTVSSLNRVTVRTLSAGDAEIVTPGFDMPANAREAIEEVRTMGVLFTYSASI